MDTKEYFKQLSIVILGILLAYGCNGRNKPVTSTFDVVIYGGTPAGIIAAIQVAKEGKSVVLLEPSAHIGGIMVNGLGGTDIDNHEEFQNSPAVGGLALEFYRRVARYYGRPDEFDAKLKSRTKDASLWRFELHVAGEAGGRLYTPSAVLPNGKTDLGAWHDLSHNLYGMNAGYPDGSYRDRQRMFDQHKTFTQGLFYFLASDPEVASLDSSLQNTWKQWGLCKDEFTDNQGWPHQFYVRDGRRMVSGYVITEHHTRRSNPVTAEDPVAVAYWPPDLHSARRIVKDGYAYNEGFVFGGNSWRPFGISYRALVPGGNECTNLLTPTCLSSSHVAYGAIRIEFTYMALGQACASAAVLAIDCNQTVQEIDYSSLRKRLLSDHQIIDAGTVGMPD